MTTKFFKSLYRLPSSMLALSTMIYSATGIAASPVNLSEQRDLYDQAQQLLDNKQVDKYLALRPKIASYPLTPYVDYRTLLVQLNEKSPQQVSQFIEQHKGLPFSTRIRAPYIDHLAREQQWQSLLDFQTELPRGEKVQCHYYYAQYKVGNTQLAYKGAKIYGYMAAVFQMPVTHCLRCGKRLACKPINKYSTECCLHLMHAIAVYSNISLSSSIRHKRKSKRTI